jgi:hypothetical protein
LKSLFSIGGLGGRGHRQAQGLNGSDALGHWPGQPEREVDCLLLMCGRAPDCADHEPIVGDLRRCAKSFDQVCRSGAADQPLQWGEAPDGAGAVRCRHTMKVILLSYKQPESACHHA